MSSNNTHQHDFCFEKTNATNSMNNTTKMECQPNQSINQPKSEKPNNQPTQTTQNKTNLGPKSKNKPKNTNKPGTPFWPPKAKHQTHLFFQKNKKSGVTHSPPNAVLKRFRFTQITDQEGVSAMVILEELSATAGPVTRLTPNLLYLRCFDWLFCV